MGEGGVEGCLGFRGTQKSYFHDEKIVTFPAKSGVRRSSIFVKTKRFVFADAARRQKPIFMENVKPFKLELSD